MDILLAYTYEVRSTEGEHNVSVCVDMCEEETPPEQHLSLDNKALYPHIL